MVPAGAACRDLERMFALHAAFPGLHIMHQARWSLCRGSQPAPHLAGPLVGVLAVVVHGRRAKGGSGGKPAVCVNVDGTRLVGVGPFWQVGGSTVREDDAV